MTPAELADAIKSLGLPSGYALAKRIGVTPRTVQKWLAGTAPIPKPAEMLIGYMVKDLTINEAVADMKSAARPCNGAN